MTPPEQQVEITAASLDDAALEAADVLGATPDKLVLEIREFSKGKVVVAASLQGREDDLSGVLESVAQAEAALEETGEALEKAPPREARIILSGDRMTARLKIEPVPGYAAQFTPADAVRLLKRHGVVFGVDAKAVAKAVKAAAAGIPVDTVVARGTPPKPGRDGSIEFRFRETPLVLTPDDADVQLARTHVRKGAVLARKTPPTKGVPGRDVCGNPIPAPDGRDVEIILGAGVELSEDGSSIIATASGHPVLRSGVLEVMGLLTVEGDVDALRSPLEAPGHILVRGSVLEKARIECGGNLFVLKQVSKASISAGGDLVAGGGITGTGAEEISIGGSLRARYLQNVSISAKGDVSIENSVRQCRVDCMGKVSVGKPNGQIVAGEVRGRAGVETGEIGSPYGRPTVVTAGFGSEDRKRLSAMKREIETLENNISKVRNVVKPLIADRKTLQNMKPAQRSMIRKIVEKANSLSKRKDMLSREAETLEHLLQTASSPEIVAHKKVHPGVEIRIGDLVKKITDTVGPSRFYSDGRRIVRAALKEQETKER